MNNSIGEKFLLNDHNIIHGGKRVLNEKKESETKPLITIITIVKNNQKLLSETFESVFNQSFKNFEYIVIDGKSNDRTIDLIKKNNEKINYWISQEDEGIYFAFNKGLDLARGELIGFVNSDDKLRVDALSILAKYYDLFPKNDFFFGSVKKHWGVLHGYKPWKIRWSWGFYSSHSTGFYIKKNAAKKLGYYNTLYKYHADYDYFFRMIVKEKLSGIATKKDEIFGDFRRGGFSSKIKYRKLFFEEMKIRYDNGQSFA